VAEIHEQNLSASAELLSPRGKFLGLRAGVQTLSGADGEQWRDRLAGQSQRRRGLAPIAGIILEYLVI
jgi:hypothetical protein